MIDDGINPLGRLILVLSARESADGTEERGKGSVRFEMMRTDEYSLDICGFVFHVFRFFRENNGKTEAF